MSSSFASSFHVAISSSMFIRTARSFTVPVPNSHGRRTATSQQHYERTLCLSSENEREEGDIAGRSVSEERVKPEIGIRAERTEPAVAKGITAANLRFEPKKTHSMHG